jgi:hypothetical protein
LKASRNNWKLKPCSLNPGVASCNEITSAISPSPRLVGACGLFPVLGKWYCSFDAQEPRNSMLFQGMLGFSGFWMGLLATQFFLASYSTIPHALSLSELSLSFFPFFPFFLSFFLSFFFFSFFLCFSLSCFLFFFLSFFVSLPVPLS